MITQLRTGLALACAGAMVAVPTLVSTAASAQQGEQQAGQSLTVTVTKGGLKLKGTAGLRAGHIKLAVKGKPAPVVIASFVRGYSVRDFAKDYAAANKGDMKALKRVIRKTTLYGGMMSGNKGSIKLPRAGTYHALVAADRLRGAAEFRVGSVKKSKAPRADATITARPGMKWAGPEHMPAKGTLRFKNTAKEPHFLLLQQVAEGTTVEDVMAGLQSEEEPEWLLPGWTQTDVLSKGRQMTMNYDLPPGQYVMLCFFPDPKMKGMPHAMMGMVRMVHLM